MFAYQLQEILTVIVNCVDFTFAVFNSYDIMVNISYRSFRSYNLRHS